MRVTIPAKTYGSHVWCQQRVSQAAFRPWSIGRLLVFPGFLEYLLYWIDSNWLRFRIIKSELFSMNQAGQHCVIRRQQLHDPQIKIASVV